MIPVLLLFILSTDAAIINSVGDCPYVFGKHNYKRTVVLTIKGLPTNLAHNPLTNDLFFTLIDLDSLQDEDIQTKMEQYVLKNGEPIKIDNVKGQAAAVDAHNNKVYIASEDGLNLLNETYKANFLSLKDEDIVQLFKPNHKDELYAVLYPENEVYMLDTDKNEKTKIENIPCAYILAVDGEDNIYYECDSKYIKVLLKGFQEPIEFVGISKNAARAIAVTNANKVVLATNDGLYHLKSDSMIPKKLMNLEYMPSGLTFDGDDFYTATSGVIYKYSNQEC